LSLGYIGYCKKIDEDNEYVLYVYSGSNWNNPDNDNDAEMGYDGEFIIKKESICRERINKQTDFITWTYDAIKNGDVEVERPCKNAFYLSTFQFEYIALHCLLHIYKHFYKECVYPNKTAFIQ